MNLEQIKDIFKELKDIADREAALVELSLNKAESFSAAFEKGGLKKYSSNDSISATVRVIQGHSEGFATTENLSRESLLEAYREALQSARDLRASKNPEDVPQLWSQNENLNIPGLLNLSFTNAGIEEKIEHARQLEKAALDHDQRVIATTYSAYAEFRALVALMNSKGLDLSYESSGVSAYTYALSQEGEDKKNAGFAKFSRDYQEIDSKKIAQEAAQRSLDLLGAEQPPSGKYHVVLANEVVSDLLDFLGEHISAKAMSENKSLLKGKIGENIFSDLISIEDNPLIASLPGARPFDSEGAASRQTLVFEKGQFKQFLTNSFYAKKLKLPHTANAARGGGEMSIAPSNLIMKKGEESLDQLLKTYEEVIYVSSLAGGLHSGLQETTLDFSLPANGFLYRQGKKIKPVHQFVMSGNLLDILKRVEKLSNSVNDNGSSTVCPDLLISDISIAGATS